MKDLNNITFISDTHGLHDKMTVKECKILCHSGDYSNSGTQRDLILFLEWFNKQPAEYKIFISGNHDRFAEERPLRFQDILNDYPNIIYLQDSHINIEGLNFYGSPQTPRFFNWAFNVDRDELDWSNIPENTDILLTHGPPLGVGDLTATGVVVGDLNLIQAISKLKNLKIHAFGHIHEGYGIYTSPIAPRVTFINCSAVDRFYNPKSDIGVSFDISELPHIADSNQKAIERGSKR